MLLLSALVVGLGNAWAVDFTLTSASSVTSGGVTITFAKGSGSTAPTWYDAGLRLYASNTITITSGTTIEGVTFDWEKQGNKAFASVTASEGDYTHPTAAGEGTWEGSATSITFTLGSSGQLQLNTLSVTLSSGSTPTIAVTPASLTGFTYVVGSGPSDAKTFSVSGSNLTANISLSLGESNYEMSLTEGSGYTSTLSLTPTTGTVASTTIYVRQKAGLAVNASYGGTITLTSTGATNKTVTLAGSVTPPCFSWDLSHDITETASASEMTWKGTAATMATTRGKNDKGQDATAANNYYPGADNRTSTRFYTYNTLTITPVTGYSITSIVFTATSTSYASALQGSTWTNATAAADGTIVTVTPETGTSAVSASLTGACGFTSVDVYYSGSGPATTTVTLAAACTDGDFYYGTYSNSRAFVVPDDIIVSEIKIVDGKLQFTDYDTDDVVPANTGVLILSDEPGSHTLTYSGSAGTSKLGANNLLKPSGDMGISAYGMNEADTKFYRLTMHNTTDLGFWYGADEGAAFKLTANKAYLAVPTGAGVKEFFTFDFGGDADGIQTLSDSSLKGENIYNLAGQRLQKMQKGINIVNGKKVLY